MADTLRELVAVFGTRFDATGANRANRALEGLKAHARDAQGRFVAAGAAGASAGTQIAGRWTDVNGRLREANGRFVSTGNAAAKAGRQGAQGGQQTAVAWGRVRDTLAGLGLFFGARELFRGFGAVVTAASDVKETMNVIQESFKDSTQDVLNFARTTANEVGRSEFLLREFAGTIGAIVSPMLRELGSESHSTAAQISTDFAKLAVDLSSFFNTSEKDALIALRAGLVGESEPLRRFGVNIVEQNLANYAGVKVGDLQKMAQHEKTLLRYQFIMDQTAAAQGDAARTGEDFANKSRALADQVRNVAVELGRKVLPAVTSVVRGLHDFVKAAALVIKTSKITEAVLIAAAAAATVFGVRALWAGRQAVLAWIRAAIPVLLMIAILGAAVLAIDDVLVAFAGGDSVFGDWLDGVTGVSDSAVLLRTTIENLGAAIYDLFHGGGAALDAFVVAWRNGMADLLDSGIEQFFGLLKAGAAFLGIDTSQFDRDLAAAQSKVAGLRTADAGAAPRATGRGVGAGLTNAGVDPLSGRRAGPGRGIAAQSAGGTVKAPRGLQVPSLAAPRAPAVAGAAATTSNRTEVVVNVNGGDRGRARDVGREVERGVRQALRDDRRKVATGVGN